jgi:hypothetical protein
MSKFLISEKYRLELHWKKAKYEHEGVCGLEKAYFSGPALSDAEEILPNDNILLDFYSQYILLVRNVYVGKLSWGAVKYNKNNTVSLMDVKITHASELNRVPKLKNNDYLVIDTSNHEAAVHMFNLTYKTYVVSKDGDLYNFRK